MYANTEGEDQRGTRKRLERQQHFFTDFDTRDRVENNIIDNRDHMGNKDWVASVTSTAKSNAYDYQVVMQLRVYNNKK